MTGTLGDADHTHPETGESFGETTTYRRGPAPTESAAAGAEPTEEDTREAAAPDGGRDGTETLSDVPHEAEDVGVQSVYERNKE